MTRLPFILFPIGWAVWVVSWGLAAIWSKRSAKRMDMKQELPYRALTVLSVLLLFGTIRFPNDMLYHTDRTAGWLLVILMMCGFGFAWWARVHIGRLWSPNVARKEDHRIVETGPYRIVRHPIYTGIITAALAWGLARGTITSLLGFGLLAAAFYVKARLEERFLRAELGSESYNRYARRVPMLVPLARGRGDGTKGAGKERWSKSAGKGRQ